MVWQLCYAGTGIAGIFLAKKWLEKVLDINIVSGCILLLKLLVSEIIIIVLSEDILRSGLDQSAKDAFNDDLQSITIKVKDQCLVSVGHTGHLAGEYQRCLWQVSFWWKKERGWEVTWVCNFFWSSCFKASVENWKNTVLSQNFHISFQIKWTY